MVLDFWFIFSYFFNISVKYCFLSFLYLICKLFEVFNPRKKLSYYSKENIITKLQKLYSPPRNFRAGNKSPAPVLKKPIYRPRAKYSLKGLFNPSRNSISHSDNLLIYF